MARNYAQINIVLQYFQNEDLKNYQAHAHTWKKNERSQNEPSQNETRQNEKPQNGLPQNGVTKNALPQNGASKNELPKIKLQQLQRDVDWHKNQANLFMLQLQQFQLQVQQIQLQAQQIQSAELHDQRP